MRARFAVTMALLLLFAGVVHGADKAELANVTTEWQNAYGVIIYTILADVKNVSDAPLHYVKVKVSLSDKNGHVVAERDGYNMGAEILADDTAAAGDQEKLNRV